MRLAAPALALALSATAALADPAGPLQPSEAWDSIGPGLTQDTTPADAAGMLELDLPYRAADAALVPVTIRQTDPDAAIDAATLVIDENPAPVAAELTFGPAMAPLDMELRIRVNQYSNVRLIAHTPDGLAMTGGFVKASGGCSAPATRDPDQALAEMGKMRLKTFAVTDDGPMSTARREAQIMIRHPNYSGLQRDQITQLFIAPHFIDHLEVRQGGELLFTIDAGISISENPVIRFAYSDNGAETLEVSATDTEGNVFEASFAKDQAI